MRWLGKSGNRSVAAPDPMDHFHILANEEPLSFLSSRPELRGGGMMRWLSGVPAFSYRSPLRKTHFRPRITVAFCARVANSVANAGQTYRGLAGGR